MRAFTVVMDEIVGAMKLAAEVKEWAAAFVVKILRSGMFVARHAPLAFVCAR